MFLIFNIFFSSRFRPPNYINFATVVYSNSTFLTFYFNIHHPTSQFLVSLLSRRYVHFKWIPLNRLPSGKMTKLFIIYVLGFIILPCLSTQEDTLEHAIIVAKLFASFRSFKCEILVLIRSFFHQKLGPYFSFKGLYQGLKWPKKLISPTGKLISPKSHRREKMSKCPLSHSRPLSAHPPLHPTHKNNKQTQEHRVNNE